MAEENKDQNIEEVEPNVEDLEAARKALEAEGIFASPEELENGIRYFEAEWDGDVYQLSVRRPTADELEKGDWEYSKFFNKAILAEIVPQNKMLDQLEDMGTWTKDDDKELENFARQLQSLEQELSSINEETRDYVRLMEVRSEMMKLRAKLQQKRTEKQGYLMHTAEAKADMQKSQVLLALVTEFASGALKGKRFFENYYKNILKKTPPKGKKVIEAFEGLKEFPDPNFVTTCYISYLTLMNGLAADFINRELPENQIFDWEDSALEEKPKRGRPKKNESSNDTETEKEEASKQEQPNE